MKLISKKKRVHQALAISSVAAFGLVGCSNSSAAGGEDGEKITLTVANFNHADAPETAGVDWWLDEVERLTDGKVEFARYHQESLCTGAEIVQCVRDGRADIGATIPSYSAGFFPVSEIMNLPFAADNPEAVAVAYQRLLEETPEVAAEAEQHGLRTLWHVAIDTAIIGANEPIDSVEDLRNQKVRSAGEGIQWAYEAVGANPVSVTAAEMYEAMQFGLTDVWTNNLSGADNYNMFEVSDQWRLTGLGLYINNGTWISESTWDSLPEDVQLAMNEATENYLAGGEGYEVIGEVLQAQCDRIIESGKLQSWEVWDQAETDKWSAALGDKGIDNWKENAAGVLSDPDAVFDRYLELLAEAEAESDFVSPAIACADRV